MILADAGQSLVWQRWDSLYIVYQHSSAETHVFNETTASILQALEAGPLSIQEVKDWTEADLGIVRGGLGAEDLAFAVERLEELGLIVCLDDSLATQ